MQRLMLLCLTAVLATACATQSVGHLNRNPWLVNTPQTLEMEYWSFKYTSVPLTSRFGLSGTAYPILDKVPASLDTLEELWLAAYLSDAQGRIVAKDLRVYLPRELKGDSGVDFEFILEPEDVGRSGPLYVTFGYRMVLSQKGAPDNVFFATQGAVNQF